MEHEKLTRKIIGCAMQVHRTLDNGFQEVIYQRVLAIENQIMGEIKARLELDDAHLNQAMNYLEAYNMKIDLLINFGAKSLQFKRVHNNKIK
jgi:hypothetical protein